MTVDISKSMMKTTFIQLVYQCGSIFCYNISNNIYLVFLNILTSSLLINLVTLYVLNTCSIQNLHKIVAENIQCNTGTSNTIGNAQIPFKQSVKNLGFTLDCHLTMNAHVSIIARTCYFELRRLASIRRFLTSTATATLVSAFVLSRIDHCNSLLFGSTNDVTSHLQRIQNYAARVIFRLPMSSSITIHLKSLHWLPVKERSTYKIACLSYHCHSSTAPSYVTDILHKKPLHTRNTRSSSYTMPLLNRPAHSKATLGDRSFSFASSSVWNSIPNDVRCAPSLSSFKSRLKTYLFRSVYKD